jgi:glutaredoxin-related protein
MKYIFLFLISFLIQNILTKENKSSTSTKYKNKTVKPNEEIKIENENEEDGYFSSSKIHELNDITFDYVIREGKIYRWFILFYSRSCGHCKRAKKEILKIFDDYKNISNLRFAEMEAYQNTMTNVRFNITGVPYMILVENNKIYEMDLFPNYDNLKDFIFTNFSDVEEELKPLPRKVKFAYVAYLILKQTLDDITDNFNRFLKSKGIKNEEILKGIQFNSDDAFTNLKSKTNKLNIEAKTKAFFYGFIPNDRKRKLEQLKDINYKINQIEREYIKTLIDKDLHINK